MADNSLTWHNETKRLGDLVPWEHNPRQMTKKQAADLRTSLRKFGYVEQIAINTDNTIIGGHQRKRLMEMLEAFGPEAEVGVRVPSRALTDAEVAELNVRLNRNVAEWDFDKLCNFDVDDLADWGFDEAELLGAGFDLGQDAPEDPGAQVNRADELQEKWGVKTGDLWQLGEHRLICGDCTDAEVVGRLMGGERANIVFTDPPYGMDLDTDFSDMEGLGKGNKYPGVIGDSQDYDPAHIFRDFGYCKEVFLWGADYYAEKLPLRNSGSWIVWDKTEGGVSPNTAYDKMFGSNFELCWSKARHKRALARVLWKGIFGLDKEPGRKRYHPTQKPVRLGEWFLDKFSETDDVVVDLFVGSGGTLIACERLSRQCRAIEIEPRYVAVTLERWHQMTGKDPVLIQN